MAKRIVIIGAGLAGTTAARELSERGQAVTLVDPAAGETSER
ncbi:FAD-dependent oxidoreductase, partial [Brevibacterium aurantiacum]